jgi:hypothetical protein
MSTRLKLSALVGLLICATSCATRTVVIDASADIVRLGPNVTGKVYIWRDGAWQLTKKTKLPEGWYAGPGPKN